MTRIRYKKTNAELVSTKPILCNNRFINVRIDLSKMRYYLSDATSNEVVVHGAASDTQSLKRRAKQDLKSIGATFYDEIRSNGKTRKLLIENENS